MEQRTLNCCVRVLLVCECRRWQRVSVALPALSPGADAGRRTLNRRQCAVGLSGDRARHVATRESRLGLGPGLTGIIRRGKRVSGYAGR